MIYPDNYEQKIGFDKIRELLSAACLCQLGRDLVAAMAFSNKTDDIKQWLAQTAEFRRILNSSSDFPLMYFIDMRSALKRLRIEGTHLDEMELFDLGRSLQTINAMADFLRRSGDGDTPDYPTLRHLTDDIQVFPALVRAINDIIDKDGRMKDSASPALSEIRSSIRRMEGSVSRLVHSIMQRAISDGLVEKDAAPAMRDGRLVIPISPAQRRKVRGIVHDESASGKTVFVEPDEAVEANNRIRELENDEKREIVRILTDFSARIRPDVEQIVRSYWLMAQIDFIRARALMAEDMEAIEPNVKPQSAMFWAEAMHPLLRKSLKQQGRNIVKLEIELKPEARMLIISGPNAGGKSVCLKTVGLLQYMLQCGLSIPISPRSECATFDALMIDIGDEQSIDNDLSTYSGHLQNMKAMIRRADSHTLLLIDEMGSGTEPQIGGAIAQSIAQKFVEAGAYGIITTHYQNLKHFADTTPCVVNGAMLYDRQGMRPLFQLAIGRPGSSFAIEIARQAGLPNDVIEQASAIVGTDYIQSDKYLQDIVRDKRYWENKRQEVRQREKQLAETIARYQTDLESISQQKREIIAKAKQEAQELLSESNRRIENTIREIRQAQADKEETKLIRQQLQQFGESITAESEQETSDIDRKIQQIAERRERHKRRREEKARQQAAQASIEQNQIKKPTAEPQFAEGDTVRMKGLSSVGKIISLSGKTATIAFGTMRTKLPISKIEHAAEETSSTSRHAQLGAISMSIDTREVMDQHQSKFSPDLDVRGMRGDEALNAVMHFVDDAILNAMPRIRILHGKGNGILRQLIRQYLATVPAVSHFADEHVQFGGAGITVVDL